MSPERLRDAIADVVDATAPPATRIDVRVERPRAPHGGDWTTDVALRLAPVVGRPAREVAERLRPRLLAVPGLADVAVAGPGFLNVTLDDDPAAAVLAAQPRGVPEPAREPVLAPGEPGHDVQYAHARACALLRNGRDLAVAPGVDRAAAVAAAPPTLVRALVRAQDRGPNSLASLEVAADAFLSFLTTTHVLPQGDEPEGPTHRTNLCLVELVRDVLGDGLAAAGLGAPERI